MPNPTDASATAQATEAGSTSPRANAATGGEKPTDGGGRRFSDDEAAALLKENMAFKARVKALEDAAKKREEATLAEQGEYKTLHAKAKETVSSLQSRLVQAEARTQCVANGMTDLDFARLLDLSNVTISEDGEIAGVREAVLALKTAKPVLFQASTPSVPGTPKPGASTSAVGFATWDEYQKAPEAERIAWARKHPEAFQRLADGAMGRGQR